MTLLLATSSPVLACGAVVDVVELEVAAIEEALPDANIPGHVRADLAARLAESRRILQDRIALRLRSTDQAEGPASNGIAMQRAASELGSNVRTRSDKGPLTAPDDRKAD